MKKQKENSEENLAIEKNVTSVHVTGFAGCVTEVKDSVSVDSEPFLVNKKGRKKRMVICGIYCITSPTGKKYIGQSYDILKRWVSYKKIDCESQVRVFNSLRKHGVEAHVFEILEECEESALNERETFYIEKFNSMNSILGLNSRGGGSNGRMTERTKRLLSKQRIGKWIGNENPHAKKIIQYSASGELIKIWDCAVDASKALKIGASLISGNISAKKLGGGFQWRHYTENYETKIPAVVFDYKKSPVNQYSLEGKYLNTFESITEAQEQLGLEGTAISSVCRGVDGNRIAANGYLWKYFKGDFSDLKKPDSGFEYRHRGEKIVQFKPDGTLVKIWDRAKDACRALKISSTNLAGVCKGRKRSVNGFLFRYESDVASNDCKLRTEEIVDLKKKNNPLKRKVAQLDLQGNLIAKFDSIVDAATTCNRSLVKKILAGTKKNAGAFTFEYFDENKTYKKLA